MVTETAPQDRDWFLYYQEAADKLQEENGIDITEQNIVDDWGGLIIPQKIGLDNMTELLLAYDESRRQADHIIINSDDEILNRIFEYYQTRVDVLQNQIDKTEKPNSDDVNEKKNIESFISDQKDPKTRSWINIYESLQDLSFRNSFRAGQRAKDIQRLKYFEKLTDESDKVKQKFTERETAIKHQAFFIAARRFLDKHPNE